MPLISGELNLYFTIKKVDLYFLGPRFVERSILQNYWNNLQTKKKYRY